MIVLAALRTELLFVRGPQACVGLGARRWPGVAARLRRHPPRAAVVLGFSGGLRGELLPGTLVVASGLHGEGELRPSPTMVELAQGALPEARVGHIHTATRPAAPQQKARLGLDSLAVDMESARLAEALEEMRIPWLVVRVILDALWENVPEWGSRVRWAARALYCARRLGGASRRLAPQVVEAAA
ncbi:MAG: hypothetical protein R6U88_01840 [Candidatus Bipolaricaulota bacterium]